MSATTVFLGRLLGLYLIAISAGMLANKRRTLATRDEMAERAVDAVFGNGGDGGGPGGHARPRRLERRRPGRRGHPRRMDGAPQGLALLMVPPSAMAKAYEGAGFERYFHAWMGVVFAIGLWMAWEAFGG
jgi:hypothetical protein